MNQKISKTTNLKLLQVAELLRFALVLNDEEIIKTTVESVIEILEEIKD